MRTRDFRFILAAVLCVPLAGCTTLYTEQEQEQSLEVLRYQVASLKADVKGLKEQVAAMEQVQQDLYGKMQTAGSADRAELLQLKAATAQLDQSVRALDAARANDRQEIADTVARRVTDAVKTQAPPRTAGKAESGYEHTVQAGQTLSAIAAAYKVSVNAILKANSITNPNRLRPGQKLFIPESGSAR